MQNQYTPNIIFVGNSRVGKTTLIGKMSGHYVDTKISKPTIKSDFLRKNFTIGKPTNHVTLEARLYDPQFDLAGSPRSIMRYQDIIVLVWSLTDTESYRNIDYYFQSLQSIFDTSHHNPPAIVICANKCDCTEREIEFALCGEKYKQLRIVKISATNGTGIQRLESIICEILLTRYNERFDQQLTVTVDIDKVVENRTDWSCC